MKDYYKLLEVTETASSEVIQAAYKILAKKYHPDVAKTENKAQYELKMKELNQAKEILLNPKSREKYDADLKRERERIQKEYINAKANKYKEKQNKQSQKTYSDTATGNVVGAFGNFFGLFKNFKENKKLIAGCTLLFIFAFAQLYLCLQLFQGNNILPQINGKTEHVNTITPYVTTQQDIINMYGEPREETDKYLLYGTDAKVLINSESVVIGWIDTYNELDFQKYKKHPKNEDISIGMSKEDIIKKWGWPDTYSENIIVYNNLIITFENNLVKEIERRSY